MSTIRNNSFHKILGRNSSYLAKNLIAISGKMAVLKNKSEHANEMTKGVVTCSLTG